MAGTGRPRQWYRQLPLPALAGVHQLDNAAGVLMVLESLGEQFPVQRQRLNRDWHRSLAGRFQILPGAVDIILDVAHNPAARRRLAQLLRSRGVRGRTWLVLGMLADKDVAAFIAILHPW